MVTKTLDAFVEHPCRLAGDVLDLGIGAAMTFGGAEFRQDADVLGAAAGLFLGRCHGISGMANVLIGLDEAHKGQHPGRRYAAAAGDFLTAAGLLSMSFTAGASPIPFGLVVAGTATSAVAYTIHPE